MSGLKEITSVPGDINANALSRELEVDTADKPSTEG
jgi:hypothetical protein